MRKIDTGKLVVITGPMFSGKTSRLLELLEREIRAGRKTILFKPEIDKRYSNAHVVTHKGIALPAIISPIDSKARKFILEKSKGFDVIGVDEAQFWDPKSNLHNLLEELVFLKKLIYVSALNKNIKNEAFETTSKLLSSADEIYTLTSVCAKCGNDATLTQKIRNNKEVFKKVIDVGGNDKYEPRCRNCYVQYRHK